MSKRRKSTSTSYTPTTFINVTLTAEEKRYHEVWFREVGDLGDLVDQCTADGYRIGLTYSDEYSQATATVTCRIAGDQFDNHAVSARAATAMEALSRVLYICLYVSDGDWNQLLAKVPSADSW